MEKFHQKSSIWDSQAEELYSGGTSIWRRLIYRINEAWREGEDRANEKLIYFSEKYKFQLLLPIIPTMLIKMKQTHMISYYA